MALFNKVIDFQFIIFFIRRAAHVRQKSDIFYQLIGLIFAIFGDAFNCTSHRHV